MNLLAVISWSLAFAIAAGNLDISDIRLVNGTGPYGGRVEIQINGIWGTVCDDSFDLSDTTVMCRMMNLKATAYLSGARYGQGIGPIYAQRFHCTGVRQILKNVLMSLMYNVHMLEILELYAVFKHKHFVSAMSILKVIYFPPVKYTTPSIKYLECPGIGISNGQVVDISADGTVLSAICENGFTANSTTSSCSNGMWSPTSIICTHGEIRYCHSNITDIRLQNGLGLYDGRVEVLVNGTWGTICGVYFSYSEARAICNILFGTTSLRVYYTSSVSYGPGKGPVHVDNLDCTGSEKDINECCYSLNVSCTEHSRDAAVACNVQPLNITATRLVNGTGPYDGRIELYVDGHWGTICNRYIDVFDAQTICNTHNSSLLTFFKTATYGEGAGPVLIVDIYCYSARNHINNCHVYSPYRPYCTHDYDLSIVCTPCGLPLIYNGELYSFNNTELTVKCQLGFFPDFIRMQCLDNGTWVEHQRCTPSNAYPLSISEIRVRNSYGFSHEGRVELLVNGTWGTVCDTDFDSKDAAVFCRMLGLSYKSFSIKARNFGRGSGAIFVNKLNCNGTEMHINNCTYEMSNNCTHYDDAGVMCTGYQLNITDIRLSGTNGPYHGRVELEVGGTWGTVCDSYLSSGDARVLCRMLGLEYHDYYSRAYFGPGSGPIYLDRLLCSGGESHINDCKYGVNNYLYCDHSDDASVKCYGPRLNITGARLVNGTGPYDGRAEIKVDDTWGTICDNNFNNLEADYFCRLLGLRAVQFYTGAFFGEGNGPVFIDQLFCNTYDYSLSNCKYLFLNECSHERDVSVVCNECGPPEISHWDAGFLTYNGSTLYADCSYYKTYLGALRLTCDNVTQTWVTEGKCQEYSYPLNVTDIRLVGGSRPSQGRVEIKSLNTWGTICDDNFGLPEANLICNMVGYPRAVSFHVGAFYGEGKGPIFVDDLDCKDNADDFSDCTYKTYDDCTHGDDVSVVCTDCGDPTPKNGFVNTSSTSYQTAVRVSCEKDYKLIGEENIICQANATWSNQPVCKLLDCGDPTPEHGSVNSSETTNGTVVHIKCDEGYNMTGEAIITCQPDETWTDTPSCVIIDCGEPKPENADASLLGNKTTYGEIAVISCWKGYKSSGRTTVSCLANGTWESWAKCVLIDCGSPVPAGGSANTTDTTFETVVEIICQAGYNISGNSVITCQEDGTWSDSPVCDASDCGILSIPYGEVNATFGTSVGAIATIKCNEGYSLNGTSVVICTAAGWNDSSVTCEIQKCNDPTPTNGIITNTDASDGYVFGNYAEIDCNVGYEVVGYNVITCSAGGVWSDRPYCELKDCGKLPVPANGSMDDSEGTKYQAQITFHCNDGYLLVGVSKTTCSEEGKWTHPPPTCAKKSDVGEACFSDEYCLFEDAECNNSVCRCVTGIYDNTSKKCDIMPLLPYGESVGDSVLPKGQSCKKVSFELGFPVFNKMHKDVFVCWYGYLTLDVVYANPTPPQNKMGISLLGTHNIIAPFNAPISVEDSEAVFYRSYNIRTSYDKMKENADQISYIEKIVLKFGNLKSFDSNFVLVVTWDKAMPLQGFDMSKSSTFQAVLASDGRRTFVFYIYCHGKMQWVNKLSGFPHVWVGYSVDTVTHTHAYSFSDPVLRLDSKLSFSTSENDVSGLVFQPLTRPGEMHENNAVDCVKWYNDNYEDKKHIDFIASMTPECPCDIWLSRFDPWFWKIGLERHQTDITYACVDMIHVGIFGHYGKSCCYDLRTWLWVYERPYAGGFQLYNTKFRRQHIVNDVIPKVKCCHQSDYCNLYYELRPTGSCYRTSPYDFGTFWGDPHFRTLDGLNFTFNGLGEYVLLQVRGNKTFDLQARTERPLKKDGSLSEATVFTAFAAKDSTDASVHVELKRNKTGIILYGNKVDLTNIYYHSNDSEDPFEWTSDENNLIISKRDQTLSVLFPSFGISLNISVSLEMLSLVTLVNKTLRGHTQGLLGNYNGNPYDDFTLPNGTVLDANLTERDVFEYGKTWAVKTNNSAFIYEKGTSHSDYHNDSYVPRFLDEADKNKVDESIKVCNGSQNIQCVFDLVFVESPEVALMSNDIKSESDKTRLELDESIPSISGCGTIRANKGEEVTCNFTTGDDGDDVYFLENNVNATIDIESSVVIFTQKTVEPASIRIASRNKNGRSSTALDIGVLLCTKCSNRGNCTDYPRDVEPRKYFNLATCVCETGYEGPDCEKELDGCHANPCSLNRTCIKLSPKEQKLLGRSYNCSACPNGFFAYGTTECSDIDECAADTDNCQHSCTNTEGGFECSCRAGYTIDSKNSSKCKDLNECDEALHNCTYICNNTEGGFTCGCFPGYTFDIDTGSCNQTGNAACSGKEAEDCKATDGCTKENGKSVCFCKDGYELDDSGKLCIDIDECRRGICPHECVNTNGSFECTCYPGYKLAGRTRCEECDILHWGENCTNDCICTGRGAIRCDNVKGCVCDEGWEGDTCNIDIDDCASSTQTCNDSRRQCVNNLGSYTCECKTGFTESESGTCEDTDECLDPRLNGCTHICENTFGSYSCKCNPGYTKENETSCIDIDECDIGISTCDQICVNNPGTHSCACMYGYTLSDDRETCIKLSDPCLKINNLTCSHFCLVESNSSKCECRSGYTLAADKVTCTDINECTHANTNKCHESATCVNTNGSFLCECPVGMLLENNGRTCSECDDYHYGKNCQQECNCIYGTCDKKTGCVCNKGWGGFFCDIDIDECDIGQLKCLEDNTVCVNTHGGAKCSCKSGYTNSSGVCIDINECSDIHHHSCDQICNNTDGSYICSCRQGFQRTESCEDIDECTGSHDCDQVCENTAGSYKCSCEDGFVLDLANRRSCKPKHQCNDTEIMMCPDNSTCVRDNEMIICTCDRGYQKPEPDNVCEDIDECKGEATPCSHNCSNTVGSFMCTCSTGHFLMEDRVTCQECMPWKFGSDCANYCSCNNTNSEQCNPVSGQCICKTGWTGETCNEDIDECLMERSCPNNSICINSNGSFSCKCNTGYFKTGVGICQECGPRHYGENCLLDCTCDVENTQDCDHETGDCICKERWTGTNCTEGIVNCETSPSLCHDKANSTCRSNTGSYTCDCDSGFLEANGTCEECSGNTYGINCTYKCDCNSSNSANEDQSCDMVTGVCMCKPNWEGKTCNEDINECERNKSLCTSEGNKTCVNTDGWYECDCIRGFAMQNDTGVCTIDEGETTQGPVSGIIVDITVTFDYNLPKDTNLNSSKTYETLRKTCETSLLDFLGQFVSKEVIVIVKDIRLGSVVVDYAIKHGTKDFTVATNLTKAILNLGKGSEVSFNGENVKASSATYKDMEPCALYKETIGGCDDGLTCEVEDSAPVCRFIDQTTNVNWTLIIGLSAGGLFVLVTAVVIFAVARRCGRRNKKPYQEHRPDRDGDEDFGINKSGKWQQNMLDFMESRKQPWKSDFSSSWVSPTQGNNSLFEEKHDNSRARKMASPGKDKDKQFY